MNFFKTFAQLFKELLSFISYLMKRKKWWLIPVVFFLMLMGIILVAGSGSSLTPFIYTLF
jgi:hypothetical protein